MRLALTCLLLMQPSLASAESRGDFSATILGLHNGARTNHGVPPLAWSETLEANARAHAALLAQTNSFRHDQTPGRRKREGENLWMGPRGVYGPTTMMAGFLGEKLHFRPGVFPNVSTTGYWSNVAHFTQMIWPTTTAVGCGVASNGGSDFLVCRYSPPGNKDGVAIR